SPELHFRRRRNALEAKAVGKEGLSGSSKCILRRLPRTGSYGRSRKAPPCPPPSSSTRSVRAAVLAHSTIARNYKIRNPLELLGRLAVGPDRLHGPPM